MNVVVLVGNLTDNIEIKTTDKGTKYTKFTLAVRQDKEKTNFIRCLAFNTTAEMLAKFVSKGVKVGVEGILQTNDYTNKEGNKVYGMDVLVDHITLLQSGNVRTEVETPVSPVAKTPYEMRQEQLKTLGKADEPKSQVKQVELVNNGLVNDDDLPF
jgi:single-strand DNA-binding protein